MGKHFITTIFNNIKKTTRLTNAGGQPKPFRLAMSYTAGALLSFFPIPKFIGKLYLLVGISQLA